MKQLVWWMASLGALCAQDIAGTWQGALTALNGESTRVVVKIVRENANWNATLYMIDANPRPIPSYSVSLQGSALQVIFVPDRLGYEGKTSGDGNSITGSFKQGPNQLALDLVRATPATAWAIPEGPPPPARLAENERLTFEVATVKPAPPDAPNKRFTVSRERIEILNRSLVELIMEATGLHRSQIAGATGWMESQPYDIVGKPATTAQPSPAHVRRLLTELLAERFGLKFHMEERELSVYTITIGRSGHKLRPTTSPSNLPQGDLRGPGAFQGRSSAIADLIFGLQSAVLDRPVVDRTGLTGRFDFTLEWRPDEFQYGGRGATMPKPPNIEAAPDLFTAFEQQLGLKLDAVKAPAPVFVIDSAQRPSEN